MENEGAQAEGHGEAPEDSRENARRGSARRGSVDRISLRSIIFGRPYVT
jgi:hypothetical protein